MVYEIAAQHMWAHASFFKVAGTIRRQADSINGSLLFFEVSECNVRAAFGRPLLFHVRVLPDGSASQRTRDKLKHRRAFQAENGWNGNTGADLYFSAACLIALNVVLGEIASGSMRTSISAGLPAAIARVNAGANCAVLSTVSPCAPNDFA